MIKLVHGNCLDVLKKLIPNSIDAIVTDPPYGLSFMGKKWDYDVPGVAIWQEALRVLKPGGHLLSFGGTRTYHRMVVNIEDAGFEIRDQIQWLYGSGFPKSHDIAKASGDSKYEGWGTALKPANEPICLARKPLEKGLTVSQNVLKYGTGGLNIDACRVDIKGDRRSPMGADGKVHRTTGNAYGKHNQSECFDLTKGRFPANLILDETAAEMLDEQSGIRKSGSSISGKEPSKTGDANCYGEYHRVPFQSHKDSGGASRFFYVAKASKSQRGEGNNHPTVKPIKLMEYLCKLITPPKGIVLDPFMGSGTTGIAAKNLGFEFIGIEREKEYLQIAEERINSLGGRAAQPVSQAALKR